MSTEYAKVFFSGSIHLFHIPRIDKSLHQLTQLHTVTSLVLDKRSKRNDQRRVGMYITDNGKLSVRQRDARRTNYVKFLSLIGRSTSDYELMSIFSMKLFLTEDEKLSFRLFFGSLSNHCSSQTRRFIKIIS